jgi:hypothetical protein
VLIVQNACYQSYLEIFENAKVRARQWKTQRFIPIKELAEDAALLIEAFKLLQIEPRFIQSIIQLSEAENNKRVILEHNALGYQELVKFNDKIYLISHEPCVDFSFSIKASHQSPVSELKKELILFHLLQ